MLVARRYRIRGRVQAVGFRFFTEDAARREGLHGFVANVPDGTVEAEAEGDLDALERFERALRTGPPGARVDTVDVEARPPTGRTAGFTIEPGGAWRR